MNAALEDTIRYRNYPQPDNFCQKAADFCNSTKRVRALKYNKSRSEKDNSLITDSYVYVVVVIISGTAIALTNCNNLSESADWITNSHDQKGGGNGREGNRVRRLFVKN